MRILVVGGGERAVALAGRLVARGDAARVVSRAPDGERARALRDAGAEVWEGDADRIGTLRYAFDNVTAVVWALGTATGDPERVRALHGTRLEMLLERTVDTTARAVVYECEGTLPVEVVSQGAAVVERMCRRNQIPYALLHADPLEPEPWADAVLQTVDAVLARARA